MGMENLQPMTVVREVDRANDHQRIIFFDKILTHFRKKLSGKKVGVWGLAFKPETDDIRCAPSLDVIRRLLYNGAHVKAFDPVAQDNVQKVFGSSVTFAKTPQEVLDDSDFLVIFTEWKVFKDISPDAFSILKDKIVFDGRNCFDPKVMHEHGIGYVCIGRNTLVEECDEEDVKTSSRRVRQNVCLM